MYIYNYTRFNIASAFIINNFIRKEEIFQNISLLKKVVIKVIRIASCHDNMYTVQLLHRMWSTEVDDLLCCYLKFLHLCHLRKDSVLKTVSYITHPFFKKKLLLNLSCEKRNYCYANQTQMIVLQRTLRN